MSKPKSNEGLVEKAAAMFDGHINVDLNALVVMIVESTTTKEMTHYEVLEDFRNKILDVETAIRLTYNEKDSDQMVEKMLNYIRTILAQKDKEVAEAFIAGYKEGNDYQIPWNFLSDEDKNNVLKALTPKE